jgi:hypothetical protein
VFKSDAGEQQVRAQDPRNGVWRRGQGLHRRDIAAQTSEAFARLSADDIEPSAHQDLAVGLHGD